MYRLLIRLIACIKTNFYYRLIFGSIKSKSIIKNPLCIGNAHNIYMGNVYVGYKCWLEANPLTNLHTCRLVIKDGCCIGNFNHIYATGEIVLEENVLTADKVYISDNLHSYEDVNIPVIHQPIKQNGHVTIGEGSWLGENVCVVGASVGKHCVIGANSVVTKDIPDYSVAVGNPARVIKKYDKELKKWIRV